MNIILKTVNYRYTKHNHESLIRVEKPTINGWKQAYSIYLEEGFMACTCPGFKYHRKQCKHLHTVVPAIKQYQENQKSVEDNALKMFTVWSEIEILIQQGYRNIYKNDIVNRSKAGKWVNKMRKLLPIDPPWSSTTTCTLEELNKIKTIVDNKIEKM